MSDEMEFPVWEFYVPEDTPFEPLPDKPLEPESEANRQEWAEYRDKLTERLNRQAEMLVKTDQEFCAKFGLTMNEYREMEANCVDIKSYWRAMSFAANALNRFGKRGTV